MRITKFAQSCFLLETKGRRVLIDPGNYDEQQGRGPEVYGEVDLILLTHQHPDHTYPPTLQFFSQKHVPIVANAEVEGALRPSNVWVTVMRPEEVKTFHRVIVKATHQKHGELPGGRPKPDVIGYVVDGTFYHPGDTEYLHDLPHATVAALPIAGPEMSPVAAAAMAHDIQPKLAIPMHYDNPKYPTDPKEFVRSMSLSRIPVRVLTAGESIEV